jgi:hypothetical protein
MMIFLDKSPATICECGAECGFPFGQLRTPLTRNADAGLVFAIDNGAFSKFDAAGFLSLLKRARPHASRCKFVACPDVVGSARRTLEVFRHWYPKLNGFPAALVCQDGQEDLPIPWSVIDAVFIGGSTEWKRSRHSEEIIKAAKAIGKWVHVGRVNTPMRMDWCEALGVDSVDGTGICKYTHMREDVANGLPLLDGLDSAGERQARTADGEDAHDFYGRSNCDASVRNISQPIRA